jgi:GNAT superfamily N-acetyltransferase
MRSLEDAGLVTVAPSPADGRTRIARLTRRGIRERARLDARSDDLAASMLAPLNAKQQDDLIAGMATVERLLTASLVEIRVVDPLHADAQRCLTSYFTELERRSNTSLDPATIASATPEEMRPPHGAMLLAYLRGEAIGCGAVKLHGKRPCEIKRMWVDDAARGLGLGGRLLADLESVAREAGARLAHIETNRSLTEAIALYRSSGYVEVTAFNNEPFADQWFEKTLSQN